MDHDDKSDKPAQRSSVISAAGGRIRSLGGDLKGFMRHTKDGDAAAKGSHSGELVPRALNGGQWVDTAETKVLAVSDQNGEGDDNQWWKSGVMAGGQGISSAALDQSVVPSTSGNIVKVQSRMITSRVVTTQQRIVKSSSTQSALPSTDDNPNGCTKMVSFSGTPDFSRELGKMSLSARDGEPVLEKKLTFSTSAHITREQSIKGDGTATKRAVSSVITASHKAGDQPEVVMKSIITGDPDQDMDKQIAQVLAGVEDTFRAMVNEQQTYFLDSFPALKNVRPGGNNMLKLLGSGGSGDLSSLAFGSGARGNRGHSPLAITGPNAGRPSGASSGDFQLTRAFMEYLGPTEGYKLKVEPLAIADITRADLSDDEDDNTSRISDLSEMPDEDISTQGTDQPDHAGPFKPRSAAPKRNPKREKAWCAAQELVETERNYVDKLHLLDQVFRKRVDDENEKSKSIPKQKISLLFSNLSSLYTFHSTYFLPELEERLRDWQQTEKICDAVRKKAPYLKMYSEYANNYSRANKTFQELQARNRKFASIVEEIEQMPESESLSLITHLICPVQRVMRYNLTMKEYLKNLPTNHQDKEDAEKSIELVADAANHANEIMKKLDKYKDVMEVQEEIGNQIPLVTASRELVKQGSVVRISGREQEHVTRYLYLFTDLLLVCTDWSISLTRKTRKLKNNLSLDGMKVLEGDNLETENTFYIRTTDKTLELYTKTTTEKQEWQEALWNTLQEYNQRMKSFKTPDWQANPSATGSGSDNPDGKEAAPEACSKCDAVFNAFRRPLICPSCNKAFCKKCRSEKMIMPGDATKQSVKVCSDCSEKAESVAESENEKEEKEKRPSSITDVVFRGLGSLTSRGKRPRPPSLAPVRDADTAPPPIQRTKSVLWVKPKDGAIHSGYLSLKTARLKQWTKRYFAVHEDFILYSFRNDEDIGALTSLPVTGCLVCPPDNKTDYHICGKDERVFKLISPNLRCYFLQSETEEDFAKWITVLELTANAQLPSESFTLVDV